MKVRLVDSKQRDELTTVSLKLPNSLINRIDSLVEKLKEEERKARRTSRAKRLAKEQDARGLPRLDQKLMSKQKLIELILTQALDDPKFELEVYPEDL